MQLQSVKARSPAGQSPASIHWTSDGLGLWQDIEDDRYDVYRTVGICDALYFTSYGDVIVAFIRKLYECKGPYFH